MRGRQEENEEIIVKDKRGVGAEAVIKKESVDEPDMSDGIGASGNDWGEKHILKVQRTKGQQQKSVKLTIN